MESVFYEFETLKLNIMNSDRIKEIQETTAYPESVSVKQALLQVWNECEQEQVKNCSIPDVSKSVLAEIVSLTQCEIPYYAYGDNEAACEMAQRLNRIGELASTVC
jgi:hypothetical protein